MTDNGRNDSMEHRHREVETPSEMYYKHEQQRDESVTCIPVGNERGGNLYGQQAMTNMYSIQ